MAVEAEANLLKTRVNLLEQVVVDQGIAMHRMMDRLSEVELNLRLVQQRAAREEEVIDLTDGSDEEEEDIVAAVDIGGPIEEPPSYEDSERPLPVRMALQLLEDEEETVV